MSSNHSKGQWSLSIWLGNLFEHYDTALFGFLSPFLAPLIFPEQEPLTALILTYAIIPLGMAARPIGSLVFGYIGDCYGRRKALFLSLAGMGLLSACIAFTPTYAQAGLLAPLLFSLGRALQNFFAAGESMGGAVLLFDQSAPKRHDLLSSWYNFSIMGGYLLASWGVFLLSAYQSLDWGWRFLYLCGSITALFGCLLRRSGGNEEKAVAAKKFFDLKKSCYQNKKAFFAIFLASGFGHANYYMALVLLNGLIPMISPYTKTEVMELNTYMLILDFLTLPLFGYIATKISREKLMRYASLGIALFAMPLFYLLNEASWAAIVIVRIAFVLLGVAFYAPFQAWAYALLPASSRYTLLSLSYALGSQILGGPTAAFSLWLFQKTGMVTSIAWYWVVLALGSWAVILLSKPSENLAKEYQPSA